MAKKRMQRCLTLFLIIKIQIKSTMRYHFNNKKKDYNKSR